MIDRLLSSSIKRWVVVAVAGAIAWLVAGSLLPNGLPFGVVLLGVILGGLSSLSAMGLVLVYRSARVINFGQAEIGGLAAAVSVVMVPWGHVSYFVALPLGLMTTLATGVTVALAFVHSL